MWSTFSYYATLAFEAAAGVFGVRLYEEPRHEVVARLSKNIEIRRYEPRLAAEVETPEAGKAGIDGAFRLLFAYIAGANRNTGSEGVAIAMTAPVETREGARIAMTTPVQTDDSGGGARMRFFLPRGFDARNAPRPLDDRVRLVEVPGETLATLRFSGSGGDFAARRAELVAALAQSPWRPTGTPSAFTYDAPFTPPFLRRNEAAVTVEEKR